MYVDRQHKEPISRVFQQLGGKRTQQFRMSGECENMIRQRNSINISNTPRLSEVLQNYSLKRTNGKSNISTIIQRQNDTEVIGNMTFITDNSNPVGDGNTGCLYSSTMTKDGLVTECLAKKINGESEEKTSREGHIMMSSVDNPNLMKVYAVGKKYIYIEKIKANTSVGIQNNNRNINADDIYQLIESMGNAIKAMHDSGFVHGDIHLGNILYVTDKQMKLIDYDKVVSKSDSNENIDIEQYIIAIRDALLFWVIREASNYSYEGNIEAGSLFKYAGNQYILEYLKPVLLKFINDARKQVKGKNMEDVIEILKSVTSSTLAVLSPKAYRPLLNGQYRIYGKMSFL